MFYLPESSIQDLLLSAAMKYIELFIPLIILKKHFPRLLRSDSVKKDLYCFSLRKSPAVSWIVSTIVLNSIPIVSLIF